MYYVACKTKAIIWKYTLLIVIDEWNIFNPHGIDIEYVYKFYQEKNEEEIDIEHI